MAWIEQMIQEGEGWLEGQPAYKDLNRNMAVFNAIFSDDVNSTLITNDVKFCVRKFVETLAEVREIASYGSDVPAFKTYAQNVDRVSRAIYLEADFPYQLLRALQYAAVMGVGYLWTKCIAEDYGWGERKIVFVPLGLLDVLPVQIPRSNDVQDAYAVTIYDYMPIAEAHAKFPKFQSQLKPVGIGGFPTRLQSRRIDMAEKFRYGDSARNFGNLYCEIRYTFVRDMRINRTGQELPMGDPQTSWFYRVPSVGQPIPGTAQGETVQMVKAKPEDCRVYPQLRLMISSSGMEKPMYDGPAFDMHAKIPLAQYLVDDWAWEPSGRSLVGDVASIERTRRKIERRMDQVVTTQLDPPMGYDRNQASGPKIEHFNLFESGVRYGVDGKPKEVIQSILPEEVKVETSQFTFLEYVKKQMRTQLGFDDVSGLENLKLNIASDAAEKFLESIGPIAKGIAMRIERGNKKIGYMLKFMIPQWYDTDRLMEYVDPKTLDREIFDFEPNSVVPSHLPQELPASGTPSGASQYTRLERMRFFVRKIRLTSVPNTLLRITQMQEQLKWLQLWRGKAPIAFADVAKKLDIDNYGDVEGNTLRERWFNEQLEMMKLQMLAAAQAKKFAEELGLVQPGGEQGGQGSGGDHGGAGRKPSGKKAPKVEEKGGAGGAPRTTVTES